MERGKKLRMDELGRPSKEGFASSERLPVTVVLDNVRSLHNVGSIFRTADAFAIESIHLCGITATPPNREINKTALGATETVPWIYWEHTLQAIVHLKSLGYVIVAAEQVAGSTSLHDFIPSEERKYVVVFGHEVHGVAQDILDQCHHFVEIPQLGTKHSLNVSVSAGIVLWELLRRLRF
ncbi:MAG: RNA methyltransferase [Flavobacteriales bacterium]|nr:RNA methyltransferase [Flavobacteriales bacterium]